MLHDDAMRLSAEEVAAQDELTAAAARQSSSRGVCDPIFVPAAADRTQVGGQLLEGLVEARGYMLHAQKVLQRKRRNAARAPLNNNRGGAHKISTELDRPVSARNCLSDLFQGTQASHLNVNNIQRWKMQQ